MNKIAFVFPGQGAQYMGMGKSFYEKYEVSRHIFQEASKKLKLNMEELCFEENDQLNITEFTQPAILTATIAILKAVESTGIKPDVVAGLSLGEYSALVANGAMSFNDAVGVVKRRGKLMQEAVPVGVGTMAAILGLSNEIVEETCSATDGIVELANYNCPGQIVISGETKAVQQAVEHLKEKGAKRALLLNVSGPFHSSLLKPAGEELRKVLEEITFGDMKVPYIANTTAEEIKYNEDIKSILVQQVYSSVKWQQSVEKMIANGVDTFVEIGPGRTLSGFIKKIDRSKKVFNVENSDDIKVLVEALGGALC
jgi:[acyl-carrier-protein] S-malonyltransferase